jgi:hypothetical protein
MGALLIQRRSAQQQSRAELMAQVERRSAWLEDDRRALEIQRLYRGHLGRRFVELLRETARMEAEAKEAWVEVRDAESGDLWYFNQATGESQWEVPEALIDLIPGKGRVKKLSPLSSEVEDNANPATMHPQTGMLERTSSTSVLFPAVRHHRTTAESPRKENQRPQSAGEADGKLPGISKQFRLPSGTVEVFRNGVTEYDDEEEVPGGLQSSKDKDRLFLSDGTVNPALRDTVRDTLKNSRFDSVATLLMGPGHVEEEPLAPLPPSASGADRRPVIGNSSSSRPMVAALKVKKGNKLARPAVGTSDAGGIRDVKSLAIRDVSHPGFDLSTPASKLSSGAKDATEAEGSAKKVGEICFNCWSAGTGKFCAMHISEERLEGGSKSKTSSALMCKNWNLGVLLKRYRSEDIQEVFMKSAASLRYDKQRKRFVTVEEQKHPIYRGLSSLLSGYNFTVRRKIHQAVWVRSLVEVLRTGQLNKEGAAQSAGMLRLRNTIFNTKWVKQYASSVAHLHPKGPVTGTTLAERRGLLHHLVVKHDLSYMFALPTPMPLALYQPRQYDLPAPRSIPMPRPSYKTAPVVASPNVFMPLEHPGSWLERLIGRASREAIAAATLQVAALSPVPPTEVERRTKYAPPATIKFASLARKATPGNMAVGGLAAELTVHELVQTMIPPQFGNYTVMHKAAVAPRVSDEETASFEPSPKDVAQQVFVYRALQHPLNSRRAPTIMVPTSAGEFEKHFYGPNRPDQTGEEASHGFRTSAFASGCDSIVVKETNVQAFEPSAEVATPNQPAANQTVTTHVDHTYPFCEPSNRNNTTLDFYHLLLFGSCAPNKEQVFTNFSTQECGEFMRDTDIELPMGHCVSNVYRSWAFVQRQLIEEFVTDDGLPYWFDRKLGETFWERPLAPEEQVSVKEGGTVLDNATPSDAEMRSEDTSKKYRQDDVRKVILKKHETADDMLDRRKLASQSAKWAREEGVLPAPKGGAKKNAPAAASDLLPIPSPANVSAPPAAAAMSGGGGGGGGLPVAASSSSAPSPHAQGLSGGRSAFVNNMGGASESDGSMNSGGNAAMVANLTNALSGLLPQLQQGASPMDLVQLGMGLGMSLQGNGGGGAAPVSPGGGGQPSSSAGVTFSEPMMGTTGPPPPMPGAEPIGVVDPTNSNRTATLLDHSDEAAQRETFAQIDPSLSTNEQFRGMEVVATETPDDEMEGHLMHVSRETEAKRQVPVFAYPPELLGKDYSTHPLAGAGVSFLAEGEGTEQKFVSESKRALRRAGDVLPEGFFNAIYRTHVGKAEVDYLPTVPNLPQPRPVGRVKPRSAAEDWFAIGFDPWSAGKDPLTREFIPTLLTKEEALLEQARKRADAAFVEVADKEGASAMEAESSESLRLAALYSEMASMARHSKYAEMEVRMNQADYNLPIDYQDDAGNTLLHVTSQNGLKRVAKLLLRRGATINKQNLAGQTVLHFSQAYGFTELFDYFMSKGADDSLMNADGLTCYEGLGADDVAAI